MSGSSMTVMAPDTPDAGPPGSAAIEDIFNELLRQQEARRRSQHAFDGRSDLRAFHRGKAFRRVGFSVALRASRLLRKPQPTEARLVTHTTRATTRRVTPSTNLNDKALSELGDAAAHATLTLAPSKSGSVRATAAGTLRPR